MTQGSGPFCPECQRPATGNFCQHCGASLGGRFCNQCGSEVPADARFCNQCGAPVAGAGSVGAGDSGTGERPRSGPGRAVGSGASVRAGGKSARVSGSSGSGPSGVGRAGHRAAATSLITGQNLPWWIAGAAMFILILFVGMSMVRPAGPAPAAVPSAGGVAPAAGGAGGGAPPDLSEMTPLEAATRLYNRVMGAVSAGDSAQAQAFLPMAIAAYQRARPLDNDGLFHLSMLNRTAMNLEAALSQALEIVEQDPNHLLGLAAAAEAAIELGELEEAERHYRRIAAVYDQEVQRALPEYGDHRAIVDQLDDDAERFLADR